jgi:hypothetical protein
MYNEYTFMVAYIELGSMAYVAIFRYDEIEGQLKTNMFCMISQQLTSTSYRKQSGSEEVGGYITPKGNNNKKSDGSIQGKMQNFLDMSTTATSVTTQKTLNVNKGSGASLSAAPIPLESLKTFGNL